MYKYSRWILWLLLTIMLNHAFVACDSIVVHLPTEHHNLMSFGDNTSHQHLEHQTTHANEAVNDIDDPHEPHAHVLCFVAYMTNPSAESVVQAIVPLLRTDAYSMTYAPAVPPPNA